MAFTDNRVRYTKMVLQQALLKVLKNKRIDQVTIKEVCDEAQVTRGTFYLHYATPNDLLMEIEQQFIDENLAHFSSYMETNYEGGHLADVFRCIMENQELCLIIMGKNGNPRFLMLIQEMMRPSMVYDWVKDFPQYKREDLNYVYDYVFACYMRLILNGLENENGLSAAELARPLDRLGHYAHLAIQEFD